MATRVERLPRWLLSLGPIVLIAVLLVLFVRFDPIGSLREVPPVEAVAIERTTLDEGMITLEVRNDGPDPVTIAQVLVDDAYWQHEIGDRELGRLESTTITIPYPWDDGLPLLIALVTSTGLTIEHEIEVAAETPDVDGSTLLTYALLGIYVGVVPVAVGLLWLPALRRAARRWVVFFLAFTVGLLAFLLVDTVEEGFEVAAATAASLNGLGLFALGALIAVVGLMAVGRGLNARAGSAAGLTLAYLVAAGIGLHNLGEGLAIGAALAAGEIALGTYLVVGFALHNTTEGLAIVAPLGKTDRPLLKHLVVLGAIAGVPTIVGAWAGGFAFSPAWASLAFGLAAGAIAQVVWAVGASIQKDEGGLTSPFGATGFLLGVAVMYLTGLLA